MKMEVSTVKDMNEIDYSDSEQAPPETHNKLLNAVYQIYKKQRINKPLRREPTSQISEFNLSHKTDENRQKRVRVKDLVRALNQRATHHEIKKKIQSLQRKSKPLPKPMENIYADKIRRKVGYSNVRKQLSRWEAIVQRNRAADQLKFPLRDNTQVVIKESNDFLKSFKEPTELEKEVAAVLQTSEIAQEEKEKEEELLSLSLEEIIKRRKLIAQMRARESYKMAKAYRQNKIKSKKYHRILKREKIKKALKDFEILQNTDPEAALEKLERIERSRAEERFTLRHRNTGKWARSQAIRAKYDSEARAQLAEQLAKSRELTEKLKSSINTSSEDEQDGESEEENLQMDPSNPWASDFEKNESEITSFVTGYKKYQNDKNVTERNEVTEDNTKLVKLDSKESSSNAHLNKSMDTSLDKTIKVIKDNREFDDHETEDNVEEEDIHHEASICEIQGGSKDELSKESCNLAQSNILVNEDDKAGTPSMQKDILNKSASTTLKEAKETLENNQPSIIEEIKVSQSVLKTSINMENSNKLENLPSSSDLKEKRKNEYIDLSSVGKSKKVKYSPKSKTKIDTSENILKEGKKQLQTSSSPEMKISNKKSLENLSSKLNTNTKLINKCSKVKTQSGIWAVSTSEVNNKEEISQQENIVIDKMFDKAENVLKETLDKHINDLKKDLNKTDKPKNLKKSKYQSDLSFKKTNRKPDSDSTLIEVATEGVSGGENDIRSMLKVYESNTKPNQSEPGSDVDPNRIYPVKPSKLNSGGIDFIEEQEDCAEYQEREENENRILNLEDAFADDDVAEEFRREKEEEIQNSKPTEVNLSLPGWGSWAGHDIIPQKNSLKRKTRRLIVKFPEILRKDEKKDYVIINEELNPALKKHMVHDLPFPFTSVKDYETSIRAPIGNNWVPQSAFMKLIKPAVITKLGAIIEPMKESELVNNKNIRFKKKK